jgi:RNA-directed DNA polymerase
MSNKSNQDLTEIAAQDLLSEPLIGAPQLTAVSAACHDHKTLAATARAALDSSARPHAEIVLAPKSDFGSRPLSIMSPTDRVIFATLVAELDDALPQPSRNSSFTDHRLFGTDYANRPPTQIVSTDISSCFEYIDHSILREELILQSIDHKATTTLIDYLGRLSPRRIGIPQGLIPSHRLADLYLGRLDRALSRHEYSHSRYVDDISVVTEDPRTAFDALELIEYEARKIGLTLVTKKTRISSAADVKLQIDQEASALGEYYRSAADSLRSLQLVPAGYDDFYIEEVEGDDDEIDFNALSAILDDWLSGAEEKKHILSSLAPRALRLLSKAPERISNSTLIRIADNAPSAVRDVVAYATLRQDETDENEKLLASIFQLPRASDWANLWILWGASTLHHRGGLSGSSPFTWVDELLASSSETVRAEAAWVSSLIGRLTTNTAGSIFAHASSISQTAVAAAIGRMDNGSRGKVAKSVIAESPLVRSAYEWGAKDES